MEIPRTEYSRTCADQVVNMLQSVGVERLFGLPGGGSNADLIEAAARAVLPFSLAHTETSSAFMATAQAEITGKPGACITTLGPGAASVMNGVAHAHLDRVPLIVLTDCRHDPAGVFEHQALCHGQLFSSLVKWSAKLDAKNARQVLREAVNAISSLPPGPIHLDISTESASSPGSDVYFAPAPTATTMERNAEPTIPAEVARILPHAKRPVFLIGLGARSPAISKVLQELCEQCGVPALVTYKAKGVMPDTHPWFGGVFTNGALEREVLEGADAFLAIGLDAVELLPQPWTLRQPIIAMSSAALPQQQIPVACELIGDVALWLEKVGELLPRPSCWNASELRSMVSVQRERMRPNGNARELMPHRVVEIVAEVYQGSRITVDAGAFMLPLMSLWPAAEPLGVLISNGLATMGFALPAAIGAGLLDRSKPIVAFTGDGGLLMCLGDLRSAAREALPLRIIVFEDGELSLIRIKQIQRGYQPIGVSLGGIDWRAVGSGLGVWTFTIDNEERLRACLRETATHAGPVLIAAKICPESYPLIIRALRG